MPHLALIVVEIGAGQKVAEDHLRDVDLLLLVELDRDTTASVEDADLVFSAVDGARCACEGNNACLAAG
jgi:hypothetical protein